jgi:RNA polymerase sigma factor (sigma-70 family)
MPDRAAQECAVKNSDQLPAQRIAELYERWSPDIRRFLWALTRDAELADELAQATFGRLVESGHGVREGAERAWLFRVAHNEAMQWRRRNGVHARGLEKVADMASLREQPEPWRRLVRDEDAKRVRRALAALPPEQRHVVEQRIDAEQTFAEIAKELRKPIGTVLTRMRLALAKLERALRDP